MFSQDSHLYLCCKYIAPNTLSKHDTAIRIFTPQITVQLSCIVTHTAQLNKIFTLINPFRPKHYVHLNLSLLRLILNVFLVCHFRSFCNTFHLILAGSSFFCNKGAHKTIILIVTDKYYFWSQRNDNIFN